LQRFTSFLIPLKKSFLVESLTNFAPLQFLERFVTADKTSVHHYEPESKAQSMVWKRPTSPVAKKFKSQPSVGKIMLTLFWDMESAILVHFIQKV
jgi:histone-lysine N-methyltransferase SETMAR